MVRELGPPVSALQLDDNQCLIAGGWDGLLRKWDSEGDIVWTVQCSDRIESIMLVEEDIIVTSGLEITCVNNGAITWSHQLEGSADLLEFHGGKVVATSSVYDIEHGDFMESGIWKFSLTGELQSVDRIDEKPWFICSAESLVIGLGRPRCGALFNSNHKKLSTDSPVTCGVVTQKGVIFGHADGALSDEKGHNLSNFESGIDSLTCRNDFFASALENGDLHLVNRDYNSVWKSQGDTISAHTIGFDNLHWCGRWNGQSGTLEVKDTSGLSISVMKTTRPRVAYSRENRVVFGFENGEIMLWDKSLFNRRKESKMDVKMSTDSKLAARLRSLRK